MICKKVFWLILAFSFLTCSIFAQKKTSSISAKSPTTTKSKEAKDTVDKLKKNPASQKDEAVVVYNADFEKGEELFQLNRPEKAIEYLERSLQSENVNPKAYVYLGICYYQIEKYDKSLEICVQGMAKEGTDKKILAYNAGNSCYAMGNYMRADASYALALKEDENYSPAVLNRANAQLKLDHLADARQNYRKYLELEPNTPQREKIEEILRLLDEEIERRAKEKPELINPDLFIVNEKMEVGEEPEKVDLELPEEQKSEKIASEKVVDEAVAPKVAENPKSDQKTDAQKISADETNAPLLAKVETPKDTTPQKSEEKSEKIESEPVPASKNSAPTTRKSDDSKPIPPEMVARADSVAPELPPDQLQLEDLSKKKALEEQARLAEENRKKAEHEAKLAEEARFKAEQEAKIKAEQEEKLAQERRALEEERRNFEKAKLEAEIAAQKKALEEEKRKIEEQRLAMEAEQKRIAAENEKKALEEELRKIEAAKLEEEKQKRIAEENQKKALEEEIKRIEAAKLEEERQKIAAEKLKMEQEAKAQAEEAERKRLQEEVAAKVRAEEAEKARIAEEKRLAEEKAKKEAEEAEKKRLEEQALAKRKAEIASWPSARTELYIKGGDNFTPDGDSHNDSVTFVPSIKYLEDAPESWELKILDPQGNTFRTVTGSGNPPEKIEWDGKSDGGETVLSKNTYAARFSVKPSAKDRARTGMSEILATEKIKTGLLLQVIVPGKEWKMVVNSINFVPNGALEANKLSKEQQEWNKETLDEIAAQIKEHPGASVVIVDGYANNVSGTAKEEKEELIPLSQMRANAIVEELVKRGVSRSILQANGMGGANPLAEQSDKANWYKNRRVEFRIKK